jgi:hypothetical protein
MSPYIVICLPAKRFIFTISFLGHAISSRLQEIVCPTSPI